MCLGHSYAANDALKQRKPYRNHLAAAAVASGTQASTGSVWWHVQGTQRPGWRLRHPESLSWAVACPVTGYQWLLPVYLPSFPATRETVPHPSPQKIPFVPDLTRVSLNLCIKELSPKQKVINRLDIF